MCSLGTDEYICRIVKQYSRMLLNLAFTRLHSTADAEDAVQEVFLRLLSKRPDFREPEHEKAWLIRATLSRASDIRKASERCNTPLDEIAEIGRADDTPQLLSALQELPPKYSAVIHLYYYEGYPIKDISKLLGLPVPTVGSRLSRGREKLRELLKEDFT